MFYNTSKQNNKPADNIAAYYGAVKTEENPTHADSSNVLNTS